MLSREKHKQNRQKFKNSVAQNSLTQNRDVDIIVYRHTHTHTHTQRERERERERETETETETETDRQTDITVSAPRYNVVGADNE